MTTQIPSEISLPLEKCNFFRPPLEQVIICSVMIDLELLAYRISSYSFRGNYSFLTFALCTVTFDHST